jgi:hypothetical protein
MCEIDISKAFDSIYHTLLLEQISNSSLHHNLVRWLAAYVRGCTACCIYGSAKLKPMILRSGVPEGSVLSPALFNFFVPDCLTLADILTLYADNFTAQEPDPDLVTLGRKLQDGVTPIIEWVARKKLSIALTKSQVTLFTPHNKKFGDRPAVTIDGIDVPLCKCPKILRVTFDTMFCFHKHILDIAAKAAQCLNLMKAVCGSSWGHSKEMLLLTFKALVESVFSFAAAVWFPNCKPSNIAKLQSI